MRQTDAEANHPNSQTHHTHRHIRRRYGFAPTVRARILDSPEGHTVRRAVTDREHTSRGGDLGSKEDVRIFRESRSRTSVRSRR